jgi:hypothetical protein
MRIRLIIFISLLSYFSHSQSCAPGGTVFASVNGTMSLCPPPPPFVLMLNYEVCASGIVTDTCGGNATRYYFINIGGDVTLKAFQNSYIQIKSGGKLNITGGANLIYVEAQPGAILTGIPPGTITACASLPPPNGSTCYVSGINPITDNEPSFQISPNPFTEKITISCSVKKQFYIFNSLGSLILEGITGEGKNEIDLTLHPSGIYFIKIDTSIKKIIKE